MYIYLLLKELGGFSRDRHVGVNPKIGVVNPPNHPFVHRVGTIIFTIHFGGKHHLFCETPIYKPFRPFGRGPTTLGDLLTNHGY